MSRVVRLRPGPKDRTAAKRMRDYRNREKGNAVTQTVTLERKKAPSKQRSATTVTMTNVTQATAPDVTVDLIELRRQIWEWVEIHRNVERLKRRHRRGQLSDQICRIVILLLSVGFFALIALSARG